MEPITLEPTRLTRKSYFRLLMLIKLRKTGWLYGMMVVMGLFLLFTAGTDRVQLFIALFALVWPFVVVLWFYVWTQRKDNARVYDERTFVLYPDKLVGTTLGGSLSEIPWSFFQRVVEIDGRILLYLTAGQMVILERSAFPDTAAEQRFREWLAAGMKGGEK